MVAVGIRQLKDKLSEYIRRVARGETILVTDRGTVVAEFRAPSPSSRLDSPFPGLDQLVRDGRARLGAPNRPDLYEFVGPERDGNLTSRLLDEARGSR